jgi:hypothetical protein
MKIARNPIDCAEQIRKFWEKQNAREQDLTHL